MFFSGPFRALKCSKNEEFVNLTEYFLDWIRLKRITESYSAVKGIESILKTRNVALKGFF